VLLKRFRENWN